MADGAGEILVRLLTAWNEADADARDAILDEALGASFTYEDAAAPAPMRGRDGMAQYLTIFRDNLPDAVLLPMGSPQVVHGTAMVRARLDRNGQPFARLVFVGTAEDGRLARLTGFVESE
jgi:ketosteroid isomerase-like protein